VKKERFILSGGTITMSDEGGGLEPRYDMRHLLLAVKVRDFFKDEQNKSRALKELTQLKLGLLSDDEINKRLTGLLQELRLSSIEDLFEEYGVDPDILKPFDHLISQASSDVNKYGLLDSINFDFSIHYKSLYETTKKILQEGDSPAILVGGTDSLEFYASALACDLENDRLLDNSNLSFVSSMSSFEENPEQVAAILKGAIETAHAANRKDSQGRLTGAFLLSPVISKNNSVSAIKIHDVSKGIVKISSRLQDAFRSNNGIVGTINFDQTDSYVPKVMLIKKQNAYVADHTMTSVAPPLIYGNSADVVLSYLQSLCVLAKNHQKPFKVIPIEGLTSLLKTPQFVKIAHAVKKLHSYNIQTVFINDMIPEKQFSSSFHTKEYVSKRAVAEVIKGLGCLLETDPTIKVYTKLKLGLGDLPESYSDNVIINDETEIVTSKKTQEPIRIKYVPDITDFTAMLSVAKQITDTIIIEALPGPALPKKLEKTLAELSLSGTKLYFGFKYSGRSYQEEQSKFIEGQEVSHDYKANVNGKEVGIKNCGILSPANFGKEPQLIR
jgi:hypothetical protein